VILEENGSPNWTLFATFAAPTADMLGAEQILHAAV
jgi:hypothetical protein